MRKLAVATKALLLCSLVITGLTACGSSSSTTTSTAPSAAVGTWADVTVAAANQQVTLSWAEPDNGTASSSTSASAPTSTYNIYWSNNPGVTKQNGSKIANVTSPYTHTGLSNGQTYYYIVTEVSPSGVEGAESYQASAQPQAALPAAPAGINVKAGDGIVTLDLTSPNPSVKYNIYWSTTTVVSKTTGTRISNVTFPFTHNALASDGKTAYHYVITAETAEGESTESIQVSAAPLTKAPVDYSAGPPVVASAYGSPKSFEAKSGNQQVTLGWSAPEVPVTSEPAPAVISPLTYNLYWSTNANLTTANGTKIANVSPGFVHNSLSNGTTHYYIVTAVRTVTNGATVATTETESARISVIPSAKTPAVPSNVAAAKGNQQVALSWKKDTSATGITYNVYWSTSAGVNKGNGTKISGVTSNSYVHSGLKSGTTYYYVITAVSEGESAESKEVSITM